MAIAYDVNINIGSRFGYTLSLDPKLLGYAPDIQTTSTLNDVLIAYNGNNSINNAPLLTVSKSPTVDNVPLDDFIMSPFQTSTYQTLYLNNKGNTVLTITNVLMTVSSGIDAVFQAGLVTLPITIQPGGQTFVSAAYIAYEAGIYDNFFIFQSNSINGSLKIRSHQVVLDSQNFSTSPTLFSTITNKIGQVETVTYQITPIFNNIAYPNVGIDVFGSITGSYGWRILSTGTNFITAIFNSNDVNNVNSTYVSNLTIRANGASFVAVNTATVTINHDNNKNISSWLSPASHYNSIIGISYDLENNQRILTIGVGMGGDGVPIYGEGGSRYANVDYLGLGSSSVSTPYPFWAKVYNIPFSGSKQIYHSNDYVVKTTSGLDYSSYFGEYRAPGSMFIVEDDGYGSIKIEINHLRDLVGDEDGILSTTLKNLTRAFHYYSNVDIEGRYTPLPTDYIAPNTSNTATTNLFLGFDYNTRDKLGSINTSIVVLPV